MLRNVARLSFSPNIKNVYLNRTILQSVNTFRLVRRSLLLNVGRFSDSYLPVQELATNKIRQEKLIKIEREFFSDEWQEIGDPVEEEIDVFKGISLERGKTGIFDIEEFTEILIQEKLEDIVVISVPKELQYVDYMVITTGKSPRQMTAVAEFIRRICKKRRNSSDLIPVVEGKFNKNWVALDLGNIALHIFSAKCRTTYDLETLWTCGSKYDDLSNAETDELASLMEKHSFTT